MLGLAFESAVVFDFPTISCTVSVSPSALESLLVFEFSCSNDEKSLANEYGSTRGISFLNSEAELFGPRREAV